jgi:hypothetical protein
MVKLFAGLAALLGGTPSWYVTLAATCAAGVFAYFTYVAIATARAAKPPLSFEEFARQVDAARAVAPSRPPPDDAKARRKKRGGGGLGGLEGGSGEFKGAAALARAFEVDERGRGTSGVGVFPTQTSPPRVRAARRPRARRPDARRAARDRARREPTDDRHLLSRRLRESDRERTSDREMTRHESDRERTRRVRIAVARRTDHVSQSSR